MTRPIKKAIFPVAGLGTRFLPATKAMPKEMLTVVDRPLIQIVVDEARGQIFATIKNNFEAYNYADKRPSPWDPDRTGFIGVWGIDDNGDVPPRGVIKGPATGLVWPAGVAINPKNQEIYAIDSVSNALFMFKMPEFFVKMPGSSAAGGR